MLCVQMDVSECQPVFPDWEFVDNVPEGLQTDCPKCSLHLREPFQVTCCENNFCQMCIEGISGPCPCCGAIEYNTFPNEGLKQSLNQIEVICCYAKEKCPWRGPLGELEHHLNLNPSQETELDGCQFVQVKCSYNCPSEVILRSELKVHKTEHCSKRPFSCEHCKSHYATNDDLLFHQWLQCDHRIKCDQCHDYVNEDHLDDHITNDCPETTVQCDFKHFGCDVELPRKVMPTHIEGNLALHMKYMSQTIMRLEAEVAEQRKELQSAPVTDTILTMDDVEHYKTSGEPWISPSFYVRGYNLYLQVYINVHKVDDEDTDTLCTTVFVCLKQGKYDDNIKWPFQGEITIEMLKGKTDGGHKILHTYRITVHEIKPENFNFGRGVTIVHPGLLKHVTNNRLHFRVPAVWLIN